jgi:hypothetical protein
MIVLEESMRHFYTRAVMLKTQNGDPKEIDANLLKAVDIADKVMPYRHHRLAAIKLNKDPITNGVRENEALAAVGSGARPGSAGCAVRWVANREVPEGGAAGGGGE